MPRHKLFSITALCILAPLLFSCGRPESATQNNHAGEERNAEHVLNFYTWADYIAPDTIASFEKLTGIKVHASYFDSMETLESRILTGKSGFDVVITSGPYFQRQIRSGAYMPLDIRQLPNLANLDPAIMARAAAYDPGNERRARRILRMSRACLRKSAPTFAPSIRLSIPKHWLTVISVSH